MASESTISAGVEKYQVGPVSNGYEKCGISIQEVQRRTWVSTQQKERLR